MLHAMLAMLLPQAQADEPRDLAAILRAAPGAARFEAALADPAGHRLQVLLAEPVVRADGTIGLRRSQLGDPAQYFYPASSIKLCGAVAALLQLDAHNHEFGTAFGLSSQVAIEPRFDGDERRVEPTLAHMLRKLLIVSDNVAYNDCVEIVGPDRLNRAMWDAGLASTRLRHRLSESRTLAENRQTRGVVLREGEVTATLPPRDAAIDLGDNGELFHDLACGTAYMSGDTRIDGPMSFAQKNAIRLRDLQDLLVEVVRPEIDTGRLGFPGLTIEQRAFLVRTLGQLPRESTDPVFDPEKVPDHACKFILRGVRRVIPAESLRVYDKIGRAYGFSTENAYVEDTRTGRGFFVAIVLYTNPDGVLNDDRYAYEEAADPFLDAVGEVLARAVLGGR